MIHNTVDLGIMCRTDDIPDRGELSVCITGSSKDDKFDIVLE